MVKRPPLHIMGPSLLVVAAMLVPLAYLVLRAFQADPATVVELVFRERNLWLLINTLALTASVLILTTLIALPLAWILTRTRIAHKRLLTVLGVVPLAVPGYVMAYALLGVGGHYGVTAQLFGWQLPRIDGYTGAVLGLSLYTFPYLFLNLRSALLGLDANLEESARSMGYSEFAIFRRIILTQLIPSLMAGWLVIGLYTLGDFGVVALMRYEVFSYAIFNQYSGAFDRIYAAWLSLMLLAIALALVMSESLILKRRRLASVGRGVDRHPRPHELGPWRIPAYAFLGLVFAASIGLPLMILAYWLLMAPPDPQFFLEVPVAFARSAGAAMPAAVLAAAMALPIAYYSVRYPSPLSNIAERSAYIGYSIPPLTLALALVFFALQTATFLYQTLALLILGWTLATVALALGPIRSTLMQMRPSFEEAAHSLGHSPRSTFVHVVFPHLRKSLFASLALVFLFCMKELPITFLLAPTGYTTLAVTVFSRTSEGMMAEAAPFAAAIILFSGLSVALILNREGARA
ncbi:iron(III) transport system permease protein [Halospina denitrificans]|uniref:Iron(III) transport system permease protein n=1 Tax=Halospina denitrificans TaxID=332522 RepID=A0A4R7JX69_9GAMM|nr:iron ABC transporter permease [Halospina denitrificans]TDT41659.1 iron(III) transport system permease protein [Halospina denitrificans]